MCSSDLATQAAALEIGNLRHGLLTYALVEEGLDQRKADPDGRGTITLGGWLQYGEKRVPILFGDLQTGKFVPTYKGEIITAKELRETVTQAQTPELFDFHKGKNNVILWQR